MVKLSRFIHEHMEEILVEWESFARTLVPAAEGMSALALRNHTPGILEAIASDIDTDQTPQQQYVKSRGTAFATALDTAASAHGLQRHQYGFTLLQLTAEYRALRATVLRLWAPHIAQATQESSDDMLRFNEAMDQALAQSIATFSGQAERARDTFLAILAHDLRGPLATIVMAGEILTRPGIGTDQTQKTGVRLKRSAANMTMMVNDLLEYTRTQLGGKIPISPSRADLKNIFQGALEDAKAAYPDCVFEVEAAGDLAGDFDSARVQQVISNLLNNAAQYRAKDHPVTTFLSGEPNAVIAQVKNRGPVIPPESLQAIFDPLVQLSDKAQQGGRASTSLGLGLFIAREITIAHGGTITVESSEQEGTVFTVRLPRKQIRSGE